nr:MAG: hypothetical protein AM325_16965 [Candidatus Thorarchaeota archaeon SMTZ1-45]
MLVYMKYRIRDFHFDEDFNQAREFLGEVFRLTGKHYTWVPSSLENEKRGQCGTGYTPNDDEWIKIWELVNGNASTIVALTILKSYGWFWINIHPDHGNLIREIIPAIESQAREMLEKKEDTLKIGIPVPVSFESRSQYLKEFGYKDRGIREHNRVRQHNVPPPDFQPPEGYITRNVKLPDDFEEYRAVLSSVFPHCSNMTKELAQIYSEAEFYNDELDLVVETPDMRFAAFVTVRIDPVTKMAELEPVGTHPHYRGLGLGKAVCAEGIRRVQKYNPSCIVILGAASTESATKLYDSLGFSKEDVHFWEKVI